VSGDGKFQPAEAGEFSSGAFQPFAAQPGIGAQQSPPEKRQAENGDELWKNK
jgi:hypothetical protein